MTKRSVAEITNDINQANQTLTKFKDELYDTYLNYIETQLGDFNIENEESRDIIFDINNENNLSVFKKALLCYVLFLSPDDNDTRTQSYVLGKFADYCKLTIQYDQDPDLTLRNVFEKITNLIMKRSTISKGSYNFYIQKLFSHSSGIRIDTYKDLIEQYRLYKTLPSVSDNGYLKIHEGEVLLNANGFYGTGIGIFLSQMFKDTQDEQLSFKVFNDNKLTFTLNRNTFDIDVSKEHSPDSGSSATVTFDPDMVVLSSKFKYSDVQNVISQGFEHDHNNPATTAVLQAFSAHMLTAYKKFSDNHELNVQDANAMKTWINAIDSVTEEDNAESNEEQS